MPDRRPLPKGEKGFEPGPRKVGDDNDLRDVYLRDVYQNTTSLVSVTPAGELGNGISSQPSISRDGRFVTYASEANNLGKNDTNGVRDIYQFDALSGTTNDHHVFTYNYSGMDRVAEVASSKGGLQ